MKTNDLIDQLGTRLQPVKRLPRPWIRFARWFAAMGLCFGAAMALRGIREDLFQRLTDPLFVLSTLMILATATLSAAAAFQLSVPGEERRWTRRVPLLALGMWVAMIAFHAMSGAPLMGGAGWGCARDVLLLGAIPGVLLFWMVRGAAPLKLNWTGVFVMLALGALGALGTQLGCHDDAPLHLLLWHFVPVILVGLSGIVLGRFLLRGRKT